ncbi:MAG: hypothetical protein NTY08_09025 [Proteobacteria bacterium]|nr:hypothetical protein [Pseudomonadota bacterium]
MHKHLMAIFSTTLSTYLTVSCSTSAQTVENNRSGAQNAAPPVDDTQSNLKSSNGQAAGNGAAPAPVAAAGDQKNAASGSGSDAGPEASTPFLIAGGAAFDKAPPFPQPGEGMGATGSTPSPTGESQGSTSTIPAGMITGVGITPVPMPGVSALTDAPLIDAVLECSKLLQVTSISLKTICQVYSNTGVALELKTVASTWKWSTINTNSCTPLKAERAIAGTPTTYDLTFVGSSVTPCMTNTVVQIDISPKSGGMLMLQASPY